MTDEEILKLIARAEHKPISNEENRRIADKVDEQWKTVEENAKRSSKIWDEYFRAERERATCGEPRRTTRERTERK